MSSSSRANGGGRSPSSSWSSAQDHKSGRIYYYNLATKETTWNKPLELATPEERVEMLRKKKETMEFFKEMEQNIMKKLRNEVDPEDKYGNWDIMDQVGLDYANVRRQSIGNRVRTISSIDDAMMDFLPQAKSNAAARLEAKDDKEIGIGKLVFHGIKVTSHGLKRRNSTGTIYVGTTMSAQNNDATIQSVCTVIRSHMLQAAKEGIEPQRRYDIFKDSRIPTSPESKQEAKRDSKSDTNKVPSLQTVIEFFSMIFNKSQLESECIIIALIYCERLVKETRGRLCIRYDNWKSILFACLVMASKVWDDMSMWNVDFSQVCVSFDLRRINELELAMLEELKYLIRVPASEYAKYYFHLRSMSAKLGYQENDVVRLQPLDMRGAKRLQLATEAFASVDQEEGGRRRTKTLQGGDMTRMHSSDEVNNHAVLVGLEQLVHTEHVDADGMVHTSSSNKTPKSSRSGAGKAFFPSPASGNKEFGAGHATAGAVAGAGSGHVSFTESLGPPIRDEAKSHHK